MADQEEQSLDPTKNGESVGCIFSPRFRSAAAIAGWDEETLLLASLIVEDTPDREAKQRKRTPSISKTPTTTSRRKRRSQRHSPIPVPPRVLSLDEETGVDGAGDQKVNEVVEIKVGKREEDEALPAQAPVLGSNLNLPPLDRLREELSCAICLEICFEPSTTPCGHSFCKRCLRFAADKCGKKCPKCRQPISNGRACTVNTVLWNTIQLLFPEEIEAKKVAQNSQERKQQNAKNGHKRIVQASVSSIVGMSSMRRSPRQADEALANRFQRQEDLNSENSDRRITRAARLPSSVSSSSVGRRRGPSQSEDAALALRLQREEFLGAFRPDQQQQRTSISFARANLRAIASRAVQLRSRGPTQ